MSEHELTVKTVADLFDEIHQPPGYLNWDSLKDDEAARELQFARAAYDLGKQAAQNDDGFIPCEFEDIRKGDTVERTIKYAHGTVVTTVGVADRLDQYDNWRDSGGILLASDDAGATYRRKPAKVTPPDPEKHPVILDEDGDAWVWSPAVRRYECVETHALPTHTGHPRGFGNDWRPAKVVAKEED